MAVRQVSWQELQKHINADDPTRRIQYLILHHTWKPTARDYRGLTTIKAIRNYHMVQNGWRDIGYNCIVGPGGDLFIGRTLSSGSGAHCLGRNGDSVGLAMVLNGDDPREVEDNRPMIEAAAEVARLYAERFDIPPRHLLYHRDYANKSCPGSAFLSRAAWGKLVLGDKTPSDRPSSWAADAWGWATDQGLMDGTRPHDYMTREQLAAVLQRIS